MSLSNKKKYLIDQMPVTPKELIREAEHIGEEVPSTFIASTSIAAEILRKHGHNISENPEINEG